MITEGFLEEERFELGIEKQLRCGKEKERLDIPKGEYGINQRRKEDKKTEFAGAKASCQGETADEAE